MKQFEEYLYKLYDIHEKYIKDIIVIEEKLDKLTEERIEEDDKEGAKIIQKAKLECYSNIVNTIHKEVEKIMIEVIIEETKPLIDFIEGHDGYVYWDKKGHFQACEKRRSKNENDE